MYQLSRSMFRELAPLVVEDRYSRTSEAQNRQHVLEACESTLNRLIFDRRYFARPTKTLFNDIRMYFPLHEQMRVYRTIERHMSLAVAVLNRLPYAEYTADGQPRRCQASTRRGKACQRQPLAHSEYCPSHQHLAETEYESVA